MGAKHIETISNETKTTKMNKPKFNIDAHAYWLLCEGQQVEVDGQKIQLTIVDEAKKTINLHTDSWAVLNDGSQRFKDTVIKWINEHKNPRAQGVHKANYYGVISGGSQVCFEGTENFTHILTIDEFCALAYPDKKEVTDTPPVKSLKYEDCFERLCLDEKEAIEYALWGFKSLAKTNPRQAKQLAATIKLMTIMHDANGGEWVPNDGELRIFPKFYKQVIWLEQFNTLVSPIYFRDEETAQRAYEANKKIFHDYFGVGGEQ